MSEMLELSKSAYANYENGVSKPSYEKYIKIAEIFQTTVQFIITGKELPADIWSEKVTPFSQRLKELRLRNGFTQDEMAKILEIDLRNYQQYEYEKCTPKLEKLIKLAELFDVTLDELMGRNPK